MGYNEFRRKILEVLYNYAIEILENLQILLIFLRN